MQFTNIKEAPEAREARLQQMREHAQTVHNDESQEARESRLECKRVSAQQQEAALQWETSSLDLMGLQMHAQCLVKVLYKRESLNFILNWLIVHF